MCINKYLFRFLPNSFSVSLYKPHFLSSSTRTFLNFSLKVESTSASRGFCFYFIIFFHRLSARFVSVFCFDFSCSFNFMFMSLCLSLSRDEQGGNKTYDIIEH